MKKLLLTMTVFSLSLSCFSLLTAQSSPIPMSAVYEHIAKRYGMEKKAVGDLLITDQYVSDHNQVTHVYLSQSHNGHEIFGANITLTILPDGRITSVGHQLNRSTR
jgi:extracellular elastinolytic metalloproteinase